MNRVLALGVAALFVVAFSAEVDAQCCGTSTAVPMGYSSGCNTGCDNLNSCCDTRRVRLFARRRCNTQSCCPAPCNTGCYGTVAQSNCYAPAPTYCSNSCGTGCDTCCSSSRRGRLGQRLGARRSCNNSCYVSTAPVACGGCTTGCSGCGGGCGGGSVILEGSAVDGGTIVEPGTGQSAPPTPDDT